MQYYTHISLYVKVSSYGGFSSGDTAYMIYTHQSGVHDAPEMHQESDAPVVCWWYTVVYQ